MVNRSQRIEVSSRDVAVLNFSDDNGDVLEVMFLDIVLIWLTWDFGYV